MPEDELPVAEEEEVAQAETEVEAGAETEAEAQTEAATEDKTVPLAALQEERRSRQALEQQLNESNARFGKLDDRLNVLNEKHSEQAEIDRDEDPIGWLGQDNAKIHNKLDQGGQLLQSMQRQQQVAQVQQGVANMEEQFKEKHSDYLIAVEHVFDNIEKQLAAIGIPENQRAAQVDQYKTYIVASALQHGKNPAEALYEAAKATGYVPSNGKVDQEQDRLATIARGIEQGKSLSAGRSRQPKGITLSSLDDMDDEEFGAATEGENWRKLWGE